MHLKVLYHANCFDGCASAAVFSRFFAEREDRPVAPFTPLLPDFDCDVKYGTPTEAPTRVAMMSGRDAM